MRNSSFQVTVVCPSVHLESWPGPPGPPQVSAFLPVQPRSLQQALWGSDLDHSDRASYGVGVSWHPRACPHATLVGPTSTPSSTHVTCPPAMGGMPRSATAHLRARALSDWSRSVLCLIWDGPRARCWGIFHFWRGVRKCAVCVRNCAV